MEMGHNLSNMKLCDANMTDSISGIRRSALQLTANKFIAARRQINDDRILQHLASARRRDSPKLSL